MALDQNATQPELFPILDGEKSVGVFYFPATSLSANDQINDLITTIEHLGKLGSVLAKHKITADAAPKFAPVVKWLARFEYNLRHQKEKLLAINNPATQSIPESMPTEAVASNAG